MAKRRRKRKQHPVRLTPTNPDAPIPVTRRFGKITDPARLLSLRHISIPKNIRSEQQLRNTYSRGSHTVEEFAKWVLKNHDCDFHKAAENKRSFAWDWSACQETYDNFCYEKVGTIHLYQGTFRDKGKVKKDFFIHDGVHRCVSLACLLLQNKIEFQSIRCEISFYGDDASIP